MDEVTQVQTAQQPVVRKFPGAKSDTSGKGKVMMAGLVVLVLGILTGWSLSKQGVGRNILGLPAPVAPGAEQGSDEAGFADESTFKDSAEGILEEGGVSGEGTHHLVRAGGPSQSVYLTSTAVDLQSFVGKKVTVWGQTISARKAGWLMDVGKIKVAE